jgi:hypothetical protein
MPWWPEEALVLTSSLVSSLRLRPSLHTSPPPWWRNGDFTRGSFAHLFICSGTVFGGLAVMTLDNLYIRADPVFRYSFNRVSGESQVLAALGDLRSYRLDAGRVEVEGGNPVWRPPRVQMIFDVNAKGPPYRTGLVTCEAIKSAGILPKLETTLLKVDYETGNEGEGGATEGDETIYLVGDASYVTRVSKRSGLSLDKLARSVHINRAAAAGTKV